MTQKQIRKQYQEWRKKHNNEKPNRVLIMIHWEDEIECREDTIALTHYDINTNDDDWILYYAGNLKGLFALMKPNNGSDFIVDDVIEFYKH